MRTKCAISDGLVRDCVIAFCASVAQYVYFLSAELFQTTQKRNLGRPSEIAHFVRIV